MKSVEIDFNKTEEDLKNLLEKKWAVIFKLNQKIMNLEDELKKSQQAVAYLKVHGNKVNKAEKKLKGKEALMKIDFPAIYQTYHMKGHRDAVSDIAVHESESFIATASLDSTLRVYDTELKTQVALLRGHTHGVNSVDWFKDSIISASSDMTLKIWKSKNKDNPLDFEQFYCAKTLVGHEHSISKIQVIENTQMAVTVSRDCTIKFWSLEQEMCKKTIEDSESEWIRCLDTNDKYIVVAGNDSRVWVYDLKKIISSSSDNMNTNKLTQESHIINFPAHDNVIEDISIGYSTTEKNKPKEIISTNTEKICVTASRDKMIKVFNVLTGDCLLSLSGHENWVKGVHLMPENGWIISVGEDKTLRIWNIEKKKQIFIKKDIHDHFISKMKFDLERMMIYTCSVDKTAKVWELLSENEFRLKGL